MSAHIRGVPWHIRTRIPPPSNSVPRVGIYPSALTLLTMRKLSNASGNLSFRMPDSHLRLGRKYPSRVFVSRAPVVGRADKEHKA